METIKTRIESIAQELESTEFILGVVEVFYASTLNFRFENSESKSLTSSTIFLTSAPTQTPTAAVTTTTANTEENLIVVRENYIRSIFEHIDQEKKSKSGSDVKSVTEEINYILFCVLSGLEAAHRMRKVVGLYAPSHIQLSGTRWKLVCARGIYNIGDKLSSASDLANKCVPPEMIKGLTVSLDCSFDMWQVGLILFEMVVGRSLFANGINIEDLTIRFSSTSDLYQDDEISRSKYSNPCFIEIIRNCLQRNPSDRWTSAQALNYCNKHRFEVIPAWIVSPIFPKVESDANSASSCVTFTNAQIQSFSATTTFAHEVCAFAMLDQHPILLVSTWNRNSAWVHAVSTNTCQPIGTFPRGTEKVIQPWNFSEYRSPSGRRIAKKDESIVHSVPKEPNLAAALPSIAPFFTEAQDCGYKIKRVVPFYMKGTRQEHMFTVFPPATQIRRWKPKSEPIIVSKDDVKQFDLDWDDTSKMLEPEEVAKKRHQRQRDLGMAISTIGLVNQVMKLAPIDKTLFCRPLSRNDMLDIRAGANKDDAGTSFRVTTTITELEARALVRDGQNRKTFKEYVSMTPEKYNIMREEAKICREKDMQGMLAKEKDRLTKQYGGAVSSLFNRRKRSG
eukprot:PhF_6_TR40165/c0_g1_i1/m.59482